MNSKPQVLNRMRPLMLCAAAFLGLAGLGRAALIMNVQSVTDAAGSTGDTLDVTLTNTGSGAVTVGGFSFGLSVGTTDLSFTGVSTGTTSATYIFGANSLFGPDISVQPPNLPGQTLDAQDIDALFTGSSVGAGATVGLGHITFNLSAGAVAGPITLSFIPVGDSLSDQNGTALAFSTGTGSVTVTSATPEPATSLMVGVALTGILGAMRHFRGRAR